MQAGIAGAGIMGRVLAFYLLKAGWKVSLFDQDDRDGKNSCSMAAAGLLAAATEFEKADPLSSLFCLQALQFQWENIIKELPDPVYFEKNGIIVTAHPNDSSEITRFLNLLHRNNNEAPYQKLTQSELKTFEPELATKFNAGIFFKNEGHLDNQNLMASLGKYLIQHTKMSWHEKTYVQSTKSHTIKTNQKNYSFDVVFDCRGLGAKENFKTLRGVSGELIWVHAPRVNFQRPIRLLNPRHRLYIVPRPNHIYILGATEIESEQTSPIMVKSVLELLSAAYAAHPGFAESSLLKTVQHVRPTLADSKPHIHFSKGLLAINGLYRHGYSVAPSLAEETIHWLHGGIEQVKNPQWWGPCD